MQSARVLLGLSRRAGDTPDVDQFLQRAHERLVFHGLCQMAVEPGFEGSCAIFFVRMRGKCRGRRFAPLVLREGANASNEVVSVFTRHRHIAHDHVRMECFERLPTFGGRRRQFHTRATPPKDDVEERAHIGFVVDDEHTHAIETQPRARICTRGSWLIFYVFLIHRSSLRIHSCLAGLTEWLVSPTKTLRENALHHFEPRTFGGETSRELGKAIDAIGRRRDSQMHDFVFLRLLRLRGCRDCMLDELLHGAKHLGPRGGFAGAIRQKRAMRDDGAIFFVAKNDRKVLERIHGYQTLLRTMRTIVATTRGGDFVQEQEKKTLLEAFTGESP